MLTIAAYLPGLPATREIPRPVLEREQTIDDQRPVPRRESTGQVERRALVPFLPESGMGTLGASEVRHRDAGAALGQRFGNHRAGGTVMGLLQCGLGLWAVGVCRRRSERCQRSRDVRLAGGTLCCAGVRVPVKLCVSTDLNGPATAGIWRPWILCLPDYLANLERIGTPWCFLRMNSRTLRGEQDAAGLLARLTVALNYFHPLVRWTAGRLRLEQELAADALRRRCGTRGVARRISSPCRGSP